MVVSQFVHSYFPNHVPVSFICYNFEGHCCESNHYSVWFLMLTVVALPDMCCSHLITLLYQVKDLVVVVDELLLEACNLNRLGLILSKLELVVLIE